MFKFRAIAPLVYLFSACLINACAPKSTEAPAAGAPAAAPKTPSVVVVELFTSQGCQYCPPAEAILTKLAQPNAVPGVEIIPLAMHVDYFDTLGWVDTFSQHQFSDRQQQYGKIFNSDDLYTPQMIVDGGGAFVGSLEPTAYAEINKAAAFPMQTITLAIAKDPPADEFTCNLSIDALPLAPMEKADLLLAVTEDDLTTQVLKGENAGQTLHHTGVVRTLTHVASLTSKNASPYTTSATVTLKPDWNRDHIHIVAFAQDTATGKILAAGTMPLVAK